MRRRDWVRATTVAVVCSLAAGTGIAFAQGAPSRVEPGGQFNVLRLAESADTTVGLGGRVTLHIAPWLGLEGEYQFLPSDEIDMISGAIDGAVLRVRYERRRSTALFGVKAGYRGERVGVFAKMRPGFTLLTDRGVECVGDVCALVLLAVPDYRPEFALDAGGVLEFYPSPRWTARVDVGSLVIRHRSSAPPCAGGGCTSVNLAMSFGVGMQF